jgi:hypothetical protein
MKPPSRARSGRSAARARASRSISSAWWPRSRRMASRPAGSGVSCAGCSSRVRSCAASASASPIAARSRGPPRPRVSRDSARSISGTRFRRSRRVWRRRSSATKKAMTSWRRAAHQLQVAAGGAVDLQHGAAGDSPGRFEARQLAGLRQLDIVDERTGGGQLGTGEGAEAVECLDAVERLQPAARVLAVEARGGQRRQDRFPFAEQLEQVRLLQQPVRQQQLAGIKAGERGTEVGRGRRLDEEIAGRDVEPSEAERAADVGQRHQIVVAARIEQRVLGDRAGGDDADHLAADDGLGAALLRLGRILHLLADGDLEALADQLRKIGIGGVGGHAAHGYVLAAVLAALGEGDVERLRRLHRIVEEQLVEIAHAVEQQAIGVRPLGREVLRHRRRGEGGIGRRARRCDCRFGHWHGRRC